MASTTTFAEPYSFYEIFHNIFAHLGLYFVYNGTNLLFELLNWLRKFLGTKRRPHPYLPILTIKIP